MLICSGIYQILNLANDKFYIGSGVNLRKRWILHRSNLRLNRHDNKYLQSAWNKYWEQSFEFIIVECCQKEQLIEREQFWIDLLKPCDRAIGYNSCPVAYSRLGVKHTEETKLKFKTRKFSSEHLEKLRAANKGKKHTEEHKRKISINSKGRKFSEEHKHKLSISGIGKLLGRKQTKKHIEARIQTSKNKRPEIWPHGHKCRCISCKLIRNLLQQEYRAKLRALSEANTGLGK